MSELDALRIGGVAALASLFFIVSVVFVSRLRPASGGGADVLGVLMQRVTILETENRSLKESQAEDKRRIAVMEETLAQKDREIGELRARVEALIVVLARSRGNFSNASIAPTENGLDAANSLRRFIAGDDDNPPAFSVAELNQLVSEIGWQPDSLSGDTIEARASSAVSMAARRGELSKLREAAYKARPGRRIE